MLNIWNKIKSIYNKNKTAIDNVFLSLAGEYTKATKNKFDDIALASLATSLQSQTKGLSSEEVNNLTKKINKDKRLFKDLSVHIDPVKGVQVKTKIGAVKFNPLTKSLSFSKEFKF